MQRQRWRGWVLLARGQLGCTTNHKLRPAVELALLTIAENVQAGQSDPRNHAVEWSALERFGAILHLSIGDCKQWCARMDAKMKVCARLVLGSAIGAIATPSKIVRDHVVVYAHFCNDTTCSLRLLKSRVFKFANKAVMTAESVHLFTVIVAVWEASHHMGHHHN